MDTPDKPIEKMEKPQKKDHVDKPLLDAQKLAAERLKELQYLQADFENYKKQLTKEHARAVEHAEAALIADLLPTLDALDQATDEGTVMIRKNLFKLLEHHGLTEIPANGKIDPHLHEVLQKEPGEKEGEIARVIQKGYTFRAQVLRTAKVIVYGKRENHRD